MNAFLALALALVQFIAGKNVCLAPPIPGETAPVVLPAVVLPDYLNVKAVGFSSDGKSLVSVATKEGVTIRTWDITEKNMVSEVKLDTTLHGNRFLMSGLRLSQDLKRLLTCVDGKIQIWNAENGKLVESLPEQFAGGVYARGLASTPDFSVIAAASGMSGFISENANCEIGVWHADTRKPLQTLVHASAQQITSMAFSTDGRQLATGSQAAATCVFDVATGKLLYTLPNSNPDPNPHRKHPDPDISEAGAKQVLCLCFSPDGQKLAIGDLMGVKIVEAATGKLLHAIQSPFRFGMSGLVFSNDGRLLARTATDKSVPIWFSETGTLCVELPTEAHDGAFSRDGCWFATGFSDERHALSLWRLATHSTNSSLNDQ